ncbi:thioredoxin domain containing protein, partial [Acanthamoeba castellanii str. Neff]
MRTAKFVWLLFVALCLVSFVCGQEQQQGQPQEEPQEQERQQEEPQQEQQQQQQEKGQLEQEKEEEEEPSTYVVDLTRATSQEFEEFVNMFAYAIIEFYAPWYEKAATQLARENNPLVFAKVDCTRNKELCDSVQVQGFPTVKLFFHQRMHEYMGPRRAAGIVSYMKKIMTGLTVIVDTAENLATYTQKPPVMV